jgi:hypothetical protein
MFEDGKKHRKIFKAIQIEGFSGSRNCIYQYLQKYTEENGIPYGHSNKSVSGNLEFSRKVIYDKLIRFTSSRLEEDVSTEELFSSGENSAVAENTKDENPPKDSVLQNDRPDTESPKVKKVLSDDQYHQIKEQFPLLTYLEEVRIGFYKIFSTKDVSRLDLFVDTYQNSQYTYIATFARGLKKEIMVRLRLR